jgi:hypothetical protein
MRSLMCHAIGVLVALAVVPNAVPAHDRTALDEIDSAQKLTFQRLNAFSATGTFHSKLEKHTRGNIVAFTLFCKDGNFHLTLVPEHVEAPWFHYDKIVIVGNKESIYATRYTPRITPSGCETKVVDRKIDGWMAISEWLDRDITNLPRLLINLAKVRQTHEISTARLDDGSIAGEYSLGAAHRVRFVASPSNGFNVSSIDLVEVPAGKVRSTATGQWAKAGNVWYVKEYEYKDQEKTSRVLYKSFDADTPISDELFTLGGLNPSVGSRLIDKREDGKTKIYNVPVQPER